MTRKVFLSLLVLLAMSVGLIACGGNSSGLINDLSDVDSTIGVTDSGFKVVRFDDAGYKDSALNRTIGLSTATEGNVTTLDIAIDDTEPMWGVALDLRYDSSRLNPVSVEFNGLEESPLEFSAIRDGLIGISMADPNGQEMRSGDFVTVTFNNEPYKGVSAVGNLAHSGDIDGTYDPQDQTPASILTNPAMGFTREGTTLNFNVRAMFALADGNGNGVTEAADITPIASFGFWESGLVSDTEYGQATVDYNFDGAVTVSDLATLGQNFNNQTTGIEILINDANAFAEGDVAARTLDWQNDSNWPTLGNRAAPGTGITNWDDVWRSWDFTLTNAELQAADTDTDGTVWMAVRSAGATKGTPSEGVQIDFTVNPADYIINGIDVEIVNATGGSGTGGLFVDGDTAQVMANDQLTLNVTGIAGTYDGNPITAASPDYAATLANVQGRVQWTVGNANVAGSWRTAPVLTPSATTGSGVTADVFPDDFVVADAEGTLVATLPTSGTFIPADVVVNLDVDVTVDAAAPVVSKIASSAGNDGDEFYIDPLIATTINVFFNFGSGGTPADLSTVTAKIFDLTDSAEAATLSYTATLANPGEYTIMDSLEPGASHELRCIIGAGTLQAGKQYGIQFVAGSPNSINKPGSYMATAPLPAADDLVVLPSVIAPGTRNVYIFYSDPAMRRNPGGVYNLIDQAFVADDQDAFDDMIKDNGNEWLPESTGGFLFPKPIFVQDTAGADIASTATSAAGFTKAYTCPGYLVVDVAAITTPGSVGDSPVDFGLAVFSASGHKLGTADIQIHRDPTTPVPNAAGMNWGINVFDDASRGDLDMANADWTNSELIATNVGAAGVPSLTPPVLYVQFTGGDYGYFPLDDNPNADTNNMIIRLHSPTEGDLDMVFDPRGGFSANGSIIAVHPFVPMDFDTGTPGVGGPLDPGINDFVVQLCNPKTGGAASVIYEYATPMAITGVNPN